jgi:hypothetical protein
MTRQLLAIHIYKVDLHFNLAFMKKIIGISVLLFGLYTCNKHHLISSQLAANVNITTASIIDKLKGKRHPLHCFKKYQYQTTLGGVIREDSSQTKDTFKFIPIEMILLPILCFVEKWRIQLYFYKILLY